MNPTAIKAAVRARDGYACTKCGMTNHDHITRTGRQLDVHRTTPGSPYSLEPGACVTLCRACHGPEPRKPRIDSTPGGTLTVRIPTDLHATLRKLADIKAQMGQPFRTVEYLTSLVRGPVEELHEETVNRYFALMRSKRSNQS